MALGSPSITTPNALDLRSIQTAIGNIRQRLEAAETALATASSTAGQSTINANAQLTQLQQQLNALAQRVLALENATQTDFADYIAGETIAANQGVVPLGDGTIGAADPSDPTRMFGLIGLATNAASAGAAVTVQRRGQRTVLGASFVPNRAVYVTFHGLTQHPDYEATALFIGMAVTSTAFFVSPDGPALLTPAYSSSIESIYEDYLPVTFRALQFLAGLESQIAALPFSSGVDADAQVPVVIDGVAVRVNAADIAALSGGSVTMLELFDTLPFNSGASADMLVPVEIGGVVVLVRAGDIAALGGGTGGSSKYIRGAGWSGAGVALTVPANDVAITCQATGTIRSATILGIGGNGSCVVDVWKSTYAGALPTVANSIVAADFPTITGAAKSQDVALTGWTTAITAGDVLVFHLVSVSVFTALQIILEIA